MCKKITLIFLSLCILSVSGCDIFRNYRVTKATINDKETEIDIAKQHEAVPEPAVINIPGPYVDRTPVYPVVRPHWLNKGVTVRGNKLPFEFFVSRILDGTSVVAHYDQAFNRKLKVSMDYRGTVEGAFKRLAEKSGTQFHSRRRSVQWDSLFTRMFDISFMPGTSDYLIGKKKTSTQSYSGGGGSSVVTVSSGSSDDEYTYFTGKQSVWKDLVLTLKSLLSPVGKAVISEASTTVTVRDYQESIELIDNYLKQLNENLSRQVLIKVSVINVQLSDQHSLGINWLLMRKTFDKILRLEGDTTMPIALPPTGFVDLRFTVPPGNGRMEGSDTVIKALGRQGRVSTVTRPRIVTLNNQVAEITLNNQQAYLASSTTTLSGGGSNNVTTTLNPGIVNSGFRVYFLPKIQGDKIYLQITTSLSSLLGIQTVTSGTGENASSIQTPQLVEQNINSRAMLRSGETLVLAGFKQHRDETNKLTNFGLAIAGGRGSKNDHIETVMLITPIILGGHYHPHEESKVYN